MTERTDIGAVAEFPQGELEQVQLGDAKVLLAWDQGRLHAVAATCPHAGGPLAEGVQHGKRIVCPWHKATFCLHSGSVLEPPAVDALDRFDVEIVGDRVMLRPHAPPAPAEPSSDARCFVILGAGAAGAVATQTLREEGFGGRVVMLDRENRVPYDRTVLSKYAISGEKGAEKTPLQSQAYYRQHRIERVTADIVRLDVAARRVTCADGTILTYDAALLATGGVAQRPDLPGAALRGVFLLRSKADAEAVLAQAERSMRAVVLGASFIGMEVAASLRERGLNVTIVGREEMPFEKQLGTRVGAALQRLHERHGTEFRLGRGVRSFEGNGAVERVVLDNGEAIAAEIVVIGTGIRPATDYVHGLATNDDGSITVDARLRAADALYAAGDVARFPDGGEGPLLRVEHWRVAQQHGRVAALNMLGRAIGYTSVPVFWTIQYLKRVDYVGHATAWDDVVVHGDFEKPEFLAYYVKDGVVVAAAGMDRDRDTAALGELFDLRRDWTPATLGARPAEVLAKQG